MRRVTELPLDSSREVPWSELHTARDPVVLRGIGGQWPIVRAGRLSNRRAIDYLLSFYAGHPVACFSGSRAIGGKFFYGPDLTRLNFVSALMRLDVFLERLYTQIGEANADSLYVGSAAVDATLPGFRSFNQIQLSGFLPTGASPAVSLWMGNRTTAPAHYDASNNIACCLVGRRRFTLFPAEQVANLYPGPLEPTPAGRVVSLVNMTDPDFSQHVRFREALEAAWVAEIEPGDVLYYPSLWWHQVEALDPFNVMMSYWWDDVPSFMDAPEAALFHAMLCLRDRPAAEKTAWRSLFDYYVFGPREAAIEHLPDSMQGLLGPLSPNTARRLRAMVLKHLNR